MSNYSELLRDPRWQRKRLEVFQRDDFTCQGCFSDDKTLHVHHIKYIGEYPWETPNLFLVTLCEGCHKWEEETKKEDLLDLLDDCGLTRDSIKRVLRYVAFKVKKHTPEYHSPFWALHNEVLKILLPMSEHDEFIEFVQRDTAPKLPEETANGEATN